MEMRQQLIARSLSGSKASPISSVKAPTNTNIFQKAEKSAFDPVATPVQQSAAPAAVNSPLPVVERRVETPTQSITPVQNLPKQRSLATYSVVALLATVLGVGVVYNANQKFAPEMYGTSAMTAAAEAFSKGQNYATFDLNINIRQLRDEQIKRMTKTPDVVLLGASHWQEANENLVKHEDLYNAHIHRDYWEDLFGMIEIFERHDRLPKKMIISLRDNQFMPIEVRKDFLWEPGVPFWRAMADKLGIRKESYWKSYPWQRLRERLSLNMLFTNITRWFNADERPHATEKPLSKTLDILLPGGSIVWSTEHKNFFTQERAEHEATTFAHFKIKNPPVWEKRGLDNFEKLLDHLKSKGVELYFVRPPFNPIYWDVVQNTAYSETLSKFEAITKDIADRHDIKILGSFNPYDVGCRKEQYIDAEHANAECLKGIFDQYTAIDKARTASKTK